MIIHPIVEYTLYLKKKSYRKINLKKNEYRIKSKTILKHENLFNYIRNRSKSLSVREGPFCTLKLRAADVKIVLTEL